MRKKFLLFAAFGAMAVCTLSSYSSGPALNGLNRTGSASTSATCGGGGCHGANSTNTLVSLMVMDANNQMVTVYVPGQTYTITLSGSTSSANLPKFGFQVSSVSAANTATQEGTFTATAGNTSVRSLSGLSIIEHNAPIAGTGSGTNWAYSTSFSWKAPTAAGHGAVEFFAILNAVNGNGSADASDHANTTTVTLNEASTGVGSVSGDVSVKAFPNPAVDHVQVTLDNAKTGIYTVNAFDMTGRKVSSSTVSVNGSHAELALATGNWAAGMYHVQIAKDGRQNTVTVVKK